jgi:glucokinase
MPAMILAGDVGATKTILGLFRASAGRVDPVREESFDSASYPSLDAIVHEFLSAGRHRVDRAAFGIAGPVVGGKSRVVNLKWSVDGRRLARRLEIARFRLLNDVEATAWGVSALSPRKLANLTPGLRGGPGNAAVIAAGTGLGMALLLWDGKRHHPCASEGGHQEFGPRDDLEIALLRSLRRRHGRVSAERVVSGPGISEIYRFLVENRWGRESDSLGRELALAPDPNRVVSRAGLVGRDPLAEKALDMFVSLYGAVAGNLALAACATAGLYVGGGIAVDILPKLRAGGFVRAFRDKGRLSSLSSRIPVRVILEPRTALLGAAACAAREPAPGRPRPARKRARRK